MISGDIIKNELAKSLEVTFYLAQFRQTLGWHHTSKIEIDMIQVIAHYKFGFL